VPGVPNIRDMGGRVAGGRRVRQGLVYRSSGLNNNAKGIYYTYDEIKQLEADGKLAGMGPLGAKYSAKLKAGKTLDKRYLRLKKPRPSEPGTARLTEEWRDYMCKKLGIKTDIDLRSAHERFGMTGSPLGPSVQFVTMEDELHGYSSVHTTGAEDMRRVLRVFLDRANYPIDFHCIGGADRTGTVAAVLLGILGVDDDEIWKDYQITAWHGGVNDAKHLGWFTAFVKSFDKFEGATLAARIRKYVLWLGFTQQDIETIRGILLE
jgi:protein-tyrosine phosphatase